MQMNRRYLIRITVVAIALLTIEESRAATVFAGATAGVELGTFVPDFSTLPTGSVPTGDLVVQTTGLDSAQNLLAFAELRSGSGITQVAQIKNATVTYINNANFAFDIINVFVELYASVFFDFDDPFEIPGLTGRASYLVESDTIRFSSCCVDLFLTSASFPPPRLGSEGTTDGVTAIADDLRLAPGESAAFSIRTAATATAVVPLPAASVLALSAFAVLGALGTISRRVQSVETTVATLTNRRACERHKAG